MITPAVYYIGITTRTLIMKVSVSPQFYTRKIRAPEILTGGALDDFTEDQQLGILYFLALPQSHEISPQLRKTQILLVFSPANLVFMKNIHIIAASQRANFPL